MVFNVRAQLLLNEEGRRRNTVTMVKWFNTSYRRSVAETTAETRWYSVKSIFCLISAIFNG